MEQMLKRYNEIKASLFQEGFLDETFRTLEEMGVDDGNPEFPFEMLTIFFLDTTKKLHELRRAVTPSTQDFSRADALVHDVKGNCVSFGALRIKNLAEFFRMHFLAKNLDGCIATAHQLIDEYHLFKHRIESLMKLAEEIVSAGEMMT